MTQINYQLERQRQYSGGKIIMINYYANIVEELQIILLNLIFSLSIDIIVIGVMNQLINRVIIYI